LKLLSKYHLPVVSNPSFDLVSRRRLKERDCDDETGDSFHEHRLTLSRSISNIRDPQRLYMNGVSHLLDRVDPVLLADHPENVQLWLPSDLSPSVRKQWCTPDLPSLEYRLRYAMATNALQDIRHLRRYSQVVAAKTHSHISNTQKTRNSTQSEKIQQQIDQAASTYRVSWCAIGKLAPEEEFGPWKSLLRVLHREDIRGPGRERTEKSESHHIPSWIWQTSLQASTYADNHSKDFYASLRVEWCKAQEWAVRHEEEIHLVIEEMRHTLVYFEWVACEWESRATSTLVGSMGTDRMVAHGTSAYARKQAAVYRKLKAVFLDNWYGRLHEKYPSLSWLDQYAPPPSTKHHHLVSNVGRYHSAPPTDQDESASDDDELASYDDGLMGPDVTSDGGLSDFDVASESDGFYDPNYEGLLDLNDDKLFEELRNN
jgi:hypothetical protein